MLGRARLGWHHMAVDWTGLHLAEHLQQHLVLALQASQPLGLQKVARPCFAMFPHKDKIATPALPRVPPPLRAPPAFD